jgi:lactoylglutathione lyase
MSGATVATASNAMLHFVYRVGHLDRTREFMGILGLKVLRERSVEEESYTNVFYGGGPESNAEYCSLELTENWGVDSYNIGTGFAHIGIAVPDVRKTVEELRAAGFTIAREPGHVKDGKSYVAFVLDPTGYKYELLEQKRRDPVAQVTLRVGDLDKAVEFYTSMGMHEVRRRTSMEGKYTNVKMGYGPELDSTMLQLCYNFGVDSYDVGDGWGQIAVRSSDVYDSAKIMKTAGHDPARAPGPVPGIGTKIVAFKDLTGWKTVVVDADDIEKELQ